MNRISRAIGSALARYLTAAQHVHSTSRASPAEALREALQPGDVLLVEGHSRISAAIKYLTQSTWSHAALYVGPQPEGRLAQADHCFVEADLEQGVRSIGFSEFDGFHTRICRPVGLTPAECETVCNAAIARIGNQYDLRNVIDLARYLMPTPPVPARFRRRMIELGSGDPTRAICSTLIAQAFEAIGYPVLPHVDATPAPSAECPHCVAEVLRIRHHSLYAPRDFDVSPYFQLIKPTLESGFDFRKLVWGEKETAATH